MIDGASAVSPVMPFCQQILDHVARALVGDAADDDDGRPAALALTFAAVACSIFCTRDPPGPYESVVSRVSTSRKAPAGS